jgi:hypothetical protein
MQLIKRAVELANKNILLVCLLLMYTLTTSIFLALFKTITAQIIVLYILISVAFFSGFFNIITKTIKNESAKLSFLEGVGDYFLPMLGIGLMSIGTYLTSGITAMMGTINILGIKEQVNSALNEILPALQTGTQEALTKISPESVKVYLVIMLSVWIVWGLISLLILYWVPVLYINNERNIFKSLLIGIKFLLKNIWKTLAIFLSIVLITSVLSILSVLATKISPILESIFFMLNYYIGIIFLFAVFLLYKDKTSEL